MMAMIRNGERVDFATQLRLTLYLSVPSMVAQLSAIAMQYIDAAMVGSLGAESSAAIGLVSTTTWLFWGFLSAAATGFSVQVAHLIGANNAAGARSVLRQSIVAVLLFSIAGGALGVSISGPLPGWLGGDESIRVEASGYFRIFAFFLPALQFSFLSGAMLRCAGNMKVPSMMGVAMCMLDVAFNFLLIFPTRELSIGSLSLTMPGAGLGVKGAALATVMAETKVAGVLTWYMVKRSDLLKLSQEQGSYRPRRNTLVSAVRIGLPMGLEHAAISGAQIMTTVIVAPLGIVAIASNAFAVIAESICYMPGYGLGEAATTLAGQCYGARRYSLVSRFGNITVGAGMAIMGAMGIVMYLLAPQIMAIMSPVEDIRTLGVEILRIEAWAEPMFGAAIVAYGFFIGLGRTIAPATLNLLSIWGVRLTLAALLAPTMGLVGVWLAMCIELCLRGLVFLILLIVNRSRMHRLENSLNNQ
ncbi:MAG: MATE family efflux transporter [Paramuribaculum sp.]|nr:MATE family efflux transporter [Paramuribaculum sp.]